MTSTSISFRHCLRLIGLSVEDALKEKIFIYILQNIEENDLLFCESRAMRADGESASFPCKFSGKRRHNTEQDPRTSG